MEMRILLLSFFIVCVKGSTHWVVTEEGKVQEQLESPFAINQPHDLVAFMKQENNYHEVQRMKGMLIKEKKAIEENEDKDLDLEAIHYRKDEDCKLAGKPLADFDLFISSALPLENKNIQISEYIDTKSPAAGTTLHEPDCEEIYDLPFSIHAYDHLEGVKNRKELHYLPESGLRTTLKYMKSEEEFANAVDNALKQNSTSWVAYNLATFYWRMKGKARQAMECVRRALHFSPSDYKDVALVNLANILHRSHYSLNASIVMTHALDISYQFNVNHFTLASIYAALGEYNNSIHYFERTVKEQPEFDAARKRLHAVKCQSKLQRKLEAQHESLQRTLHELQAYQEKHKKYLELQLTVEKMQLSRQDQINLHFQLMQYLIKQGTFDHKLCKFRSNESGPVMFCNLPAPTDKETKVDLEPKIDERAHVLSAKPTKFASGADSGTFKPSGSQTKIDYNNWNDPGWPTQGHCDEYAPKTLAWDEYPSSYINPQIRGYEVHDLLTSYIGVKEGENLPHPWTELNCEILEPVAESSTLDRIQSVVDRHSAPMHKQDIYMTREMLMHANEGHVWPGDLGHRIHTAITKSLKAKDADHNLWILYNYAGLFFRVQGDNLKAVECIRRAAHRTPPQHYDIPLLNLANIMYRLGKVNDAMFLLVEALGVNNTEPVSYLAMGNALQARNNITGSIQFYEYGLLLRPNYWECFNALINVKCQAIRDKKLQEDHKIIEYQISHQANQQQPTETVHAEQTCSNKNKHCNGEINSEVKENLEDVKEKKYGEDVHLESGSSLFYTVSAFPVSEDRTTREVECENVSNKNELVRRLELRKENADKILQEADDVIKRLASVAGDNSEELNMRVSTAKEIMQQLTQMRDSLGSLVQEASTTLEKVTGPDQNQYEDQFFSVDCEETLRSIDLRSFLSFDFDESERGYDFGEELPSVAEAAVDSEPYCVAASTLSGYNVDHLDSVKNRNSFSPYSPEYGMKVHLEQVLQDEENTDFFLITRRLSEGLKQNFPSWRLSILASYYWRLQGKAKEAIDCLRVALSSAPLDMRDIVLLGMANVFAQIAQWKDAMYAAEQVKILFPDTFIHHFTLANILAAKGDVQKSIPHFKKAAQLRPEMEIAVKRLEAAICEQQLNDNH